MADSEESRLLFFDTFSHETKEELNLDLVQFPRPVQVNEVRIVPLGTKIHADVPGGVRLGATNPSEFQLELFVNNLSIPNAATFEKLGTLNYEKNIEIQLVPDSKVATDGLILKGWYSTITVAVYGTPTTVQKERSSPPPPPPPSQPRGKSQESRPTSEFQPPPPSQPVDLPERPVDWDSHSSIEPPFNTQQPSMPTAGGPGHMPEGFRDLDDRHHPPPPPDLLRDTREIPMDSQGRVHDPRDVPRDMRERDMHDPNDRYDDRRKDREPRDRRKRGSRESRERSLSPERDYREPKDNSRENELRDYRERHRDERESEKDWEREREKERERIRERERAYRDRDKNRNNDRGGRDRDRSQRRSRTPERRERRSRSPMSRGSSHSRDPFPGPPEDETEPGEIQEPMLQDMFEPLSGDDDRSEKGQFPLSDGEIREYEPISSDEDMFPDFRDSSFPMGDLEDADIDETLSDPIPPFNPYNVYLVPLDTFPDPSLTKYEVTKNKYILSREEFEMPESAKQLIELVKSYTDTDHFDSWIEAMEGVPALLVPGLAYIVTNTEHKEVLDKLILWAFEGLDLQKAMAQPTTAFKVRHLKMGIRLAGVLTACDSYVAFRMLSQDVQQKLIDLFNSQYMSSSVKLQIVRALDETTRLKDGMDWFLGRHHLQTGQGEEVKKEDEFKTEQQEEIATSNPTGYQQMVSIMLKKQNVRSMVSLSNLIRKVHIYEAFNRLTYGVERMQDRFEKWLADNTQIAEKDSSKSPKGDGDDLDGIMAGDPDTSDPNIIVDNVNDEDVENILSCLEEANNIMANANYLIAQPKNTLPARVQFAITHKPHDPYPGLFHMFNTCRVFESVFVLLSSPATSGHSGMFSTIKDLILHFLKSQQGMAFLSSKPDTVNGIIRALLQSDYGEEESKEDNPAQQLGLEMVFHLQTLQLLDQLRMYHEKSPGEKGIDDAEALGVLHSLYSMTFTHVGKEFVSYVLSQDENLTALLPFIETSGEEEKEILFKKSVSVGYTFQLLLMVIRVADNVEMLEKFGSRLLALTENQEFGFRNDRVQEFQDYLTPLKAVTKISHDDLEELIKNLKHYGEDILDAPKGLITTLRILKHLAIPPEFTGPKGDNVEELKYMFVIVELYSADCLHVLINILTKINEAMVRPWQQGFPLSCTNGYQLLAMVKPALSIVRAMLSYVIKARGAEFKDLSCLQPLFNLHTVVCSISPTGNLDSTAQAIQSDIVGAILAFTQPAMQVGESEEALGQSLWTLMVKELIKYIGSAPHRYLGGLALVSELLPLPLPIQTREVLSPQEVVQAINFRKVWSAHLHPLNKEIANIIKDLAGTACQPLQLLLRRVCWQLADLSAPSALLIARCLLDALLESMDETKTRLAPPDQQEVMPPEEKATEEKEIKEYRSSGLTARILNLLSFLANQAPIKAAYLSVSRPGSKGDEKYCDVMPRLIHLLNVVDEKQSHIQAQEAIVSFIQSLCDMDVTLVTGDLDEIPATDQLANALPTKEQLELICSGLLDHIGQTNYHNYSSVLPSLRTLALLMDHNHGFYHLKCALEKNITAIFNLFMRINSTFSKDSSDCIATLSSAAECIQFLVALPETPEDTELTGIERTYTLSPTELKELLSWKSDQDSHPIDDLETLLNEYAKDEETLKAVHESMNALVQVLKIEEEVPKQELAEPELPSPETITNQFNMRACFLISDIEDDRLNASYWLSNPMIDDSDQEPDLMKSDFMEMIQKYCQDFDLVAELAKGTIDADDITIRSRKWRNRRSNADTINTSKMRGPGKFVAPMRGRGFNRGFQGGGRHDPFRSRQQNTSRAPSMHVDDFVKMQNNQDSGPMPVPVLAPRGRDKEGRGRGFDRGRGFPNSRKFFSPPGNYGRREDGTNRGGYNQRGGLGGRGGSPLGRGMNERGGFRGRGMGPGRGSPGGQRANPWNRNPRQSGGFPGSRGFGRGDNRSQSMDRRNIRDDRGGRFGKSNRGQWNRDMDSRSMPPPGFRRDRGRHQRSFTK